MFDQKPIEISVASLTVPEKDRRPDPRFPEGPVTVTIQTTKQPDPGALGDPSVFIEA